MSDRAKQGGLRRGLVALTRWFDTEAGVDAPPGPDDRRPEWTRIVPFIGLHLACLAVIWVGVSATALALALGLYLVRMFAITGAYHRYFSHRSYKTSRPMQFFLALLGAAAVQRGPIWWAAHHRHHHRHSDTEEDAHSPIAHSFWHSHVLWFTTREGFRTRRELVPDLLKYPELRFLDRFDIVVPVLLAVGLFFTGAWLEGAAPSLGVSGAQFLVWGFFVSTVLLFHGTAVINSLAHRMGRKRYLTGDESRNSLLLALVTLGEGWHNNHHKYPGSVRQGFFWWEIDLTYYVLRALSLVGLVWDLRPVPERVLAAAGEAHQALPESESLPLAGAGSSSAEGQEDEARARREVGAAS